MYERGFRLEIVTPERMVFANEATSVTVPGVVGSFQVLYNHAPLLSGLDIGALRVRDPGGQEQVFATSGGFVDVRDNKVVVLVETAERSGDIDVERARKAKERATQRLHAQEDTDVLRAQLALARALNRINVASKG